VDSCTGLSGPYAHWVNEFGHAAITQVSYSIGGQIIDTVFSHFAHMWHELSDAPGKQLREMVGKYDTVAELVHAAEGPQTFWVPLDFYFTQDPGDCLPLVSLQFHYVQLQVTFAPLEKLIQVSHCDVQVVRCIDGAPLTKQDFNASVACNYVYLDMEERDCFAEGAYEVLIKQVQMYSTTTKSGGSAHISLNFNHPTIEFIWAGQRWCNAVANNTFNYMGAFGKPIFTSIKCSLNNLCCFQNGPEYFNQVQPYEHHTCIPKNKGIYCYSWALYPQSHQPSGSVNLSRIDSIDVDFCMQGAVQNESIAIYFFCLNWNILRLKSGLGGLMYSSNPLFAGSSLAVNWI
jgi:hypothetical protein